MKQGISKAVLAAVLLVCAGTGGLAAADDIHAAARMGDVAAVQRLLADGTVADARDERGATPLHVLASDGQRTEAARQARERIARVLLAKGADVDAVDNEGMTALHVALARQREELWRLLVERGADVNAANSHGRTPLHFAAMSGSTKAIDLLLRKKAEINAADAAGDTPLHVAALRLRVEASKTLLSGGADALAVNKRGETALHVLAGQNLRTPGADGPLVNVAELLLEHGVDVNHRAEDGTTALGRAQAKEHSQLARLLTAKGGVK